MQHLDVELLCFHGCRRLGGPETVTGHINIRPVELSRHNFYFFEKIIDSESAWADVPTMSNMHVLANLFYWATAILLFSVVVSVAQDESTSQSFEGWTCDALTPNLCDLSVETGLVPMKGGLSVKYWRYYQKQEHGDISGEEHEELPPLIVAHGGPAFPHRYLLPLKQIACQAQRSVIFYDQAGCGDSPLPFDSNNGTNSSNTTVSVSYPWLLDPNYYALEELPKLIDALGIQDFHLLGHSWGTILAQIFALDSDSPVQSRMKSMTLSGCISDTQFYIQEQWDHHHGTLGRLPPFLRDQIQKLEDEQDYDSLAYQALDDFLTVKFTTRMTPLPDCFVEAAAGVNREIYVGMQGASEFTMHGVLADFNVTERLAELVDQPVLLLSGSFDTVRPTVAQRMLEHLPVAEWHLFRNSGHVSAIDEAGSMNDLVADFLSRVEAVSTLEDFHPKAIPISPCDIEGYAAPNNGDGSNKTPKEWAILLVVAFLSLAVGFVMGRAGPRRSGTPYERIPS